ncbi:hypothetical protein IE81DRAFT_365734 [Ceraceosorus guamensis]|uniref:PH domain-containing protein n=1 Tax=Ceraceosorus guamensis TaxID=1522189 RepID=A0A316W1B3_9BASI|nr:hypothetical protein IE81DRAFT_365734 [Ceraceosorus guamensis]PWN43512.1 hypothetical protein IE81DRAFT_365734 [Ceraceosorus guamensis]
MDSTSETEDADARPKLRSKPPAISPRRTSTSAEKESLADDDVAPVVKVDEPTFQSGVQAEGLPTEPTCARPMAQEDGAEQQSASAEMHGITAKRPLPKAPILVDVARDMQDDLQDAHSVIANGENNTTAGSLPVLEDAPDASSEVNTFTSAESYKEASKGGQGCSSGEGDVPLTVLEQSDADTLLAAQLDLHDGPACPRTAGIQDSTPTLSKSSSADLPEDNDLPNLSPPSDPSTDLHVASVAADSTLHTEATPDPSILPEDNISGLALSDIAAQTIAAPRTSDVSDATTSAATCIDHGSQYHYCVGDEIVISDRENDIHRLHRPAAPHDLDRTPSVRSIETVRPSSAQLKLGSATVYPFQPSSPAITRGFSTTGSVRSVAGSTSRWVTSMVNRAMFSKQALRDKAEAAKSVLAGPLAKVASSSTPNLTHSDDSEKELISQLVLEESGARVPKSSVTKARSLYAKRDSIDSDSEVAYTSLEVPYGAAEVMSARDRAAEDARVAGGTDGTLMVVNDDIERAQCSALDPQHQDRLVAESLAREISSGVLGPEEQAVLDMLEEMSNASEHAESSPQQHVHSRLDAPRPSLPRSGSVKERVMAMQRGDSRVVNAHSSDSGSHISAASGRSFCSAAEGSLSPGMEAAHQTSPRPAHQRSLTAESSSVTSMNSQSSSIMSREARNRATMDTAGPRLPIASDSEQAARPRFPPPRRAGQRSAHLGPFSPNSSTLAGSHMSQSGSGLNFWSRMEQRSPSTAPTSPGLPMSSDASPFPPEFYSHKLGTAGGHGRHHPYPPMLRRLETDMTAATSVSSGIHSIHKGSASVLLPTPTTAGLVRSPGTPPTTAGYDAATYMVSKQQCASPLEQVAPSSPSKLAYSESSNWSSAKTHDVARDIKTFPVATSEAVRKQIGDLDTPSETPSDAARADRQLEGLGIAALDAHVRSHTDRDASLGPGATSHLVSPVRTQKRDLPAHDSTRSLRSLHPALSDSTFAVGHSISNSQSEKAIAGPALRSQLRAPGTPTKARDLIAFFEQEMQSVPSPSNAPSAQAVAQPKPTKSRAAEVPFGKHTPSQEIAERYRKALRDKPESLVSSPASITPSSKLSFRVDNELSTAPEQSDAAAETSKLALRRRAQVSASRARIAAVGAEMISQVVADEENREPGPLDTLDGPTRTPSRSPRRVLSGSRKPSPSLFGFSTSPLHIRRTSAERQRTNASPTADPKGPPSVSAGTKSAGSSPTRRGGSGSTGSVSLAGGVRNLARAFSRGATPSDPLREASRASDAAEAQAPPSAWRSGESGGQVAEARRMSDDRSALSARTHGTQASFRQNVESGRLPLDNRGALELIGEHRQRAAPLRQGTVFYFNVHHRQPHWQRAQAILLPTAVALSWIPRGGGRENVVLDLRACLEVFSLPSAVHPNSQHDVAAQTALAQGLGDIHAFQLVFDDGVERIAVDRAIDRVQWITAAWEALGMAQGRDTSAQQGQTQVLESQSPSACGDNQVSVNQAVQLLVGQSQSQVLASAQSDPISPSTGGGSGKETIQRIAGIWASEPSSGNEQPPRPPPVPPKDRPSPERPLTEAPRAHASPQTWRKPVQDNSHDTALVVSTPFEQDRASPPPSEFDWDSSSRELVPSDSASQRPPRSDCEASCISRPGSDLQNLAAHLSAEARPKRAPGGAALELTSQSAAKAAPANLPREESRLLETVLEETQSQAQSTQVKPPSLQHSDLASALKRTPRKQGRTSLPKAEESAECEDILSITKPVIAARSSLSSKNGSASVSSGDVARLLTYLEEQQAAREAREAHLEEQIRSFQDVIAGLQRKISSASKRSTTAHELSERSSSRRRSSAGTTASSKDEGASTPRRNDHAELAAVQEKLDRVLSLVGNVFEGQTRLQEKAQAQATDTAVPKGDDLVSTRSDHELLKVQETLEKLLDRMQSQVDTTSSLNGRGTLRELVREAGLPRALRPENRNLDGDPIDGRDQAILADRPKRSRTSAPATLEMSREDQEKIPLPPSSSASTLSRERVPARDWRSELGVPPTPANTDAASSYAPSIRSQATTLRGRAPDDVFLYGAAPSTSASEARPPKAIFAPHTSQVGLNMEAEVRRQRGTQQGNSNAGWYGAPDLPEKDNTVRWARSNLVQRDQRSPSQPSGMVATGMSMPDPSSYGNERCDLSPGSFKEQSKPSPELEAVLQAIRDNEGARAAQQAQQQDIARYLNELNTWLEKDVVDRSKEWRELTSGVSQLHQELAQLKTGSGPTTVAEAPRSGPGVADAGNQHLQRSATTSSRGVSGAPPTSSGSADLASYQLSDGRAAPPPREPPPFGNGGQWTAHTAAGGGGGFPPNAAAAGAPPALFTPAPLSRSGTRTWHSEASPGALRNQDVWAHSGSRANSKKLSKEEKAARKRSDRRNFLSKLGPLAAAAGGAALVHAAVSEWDAHKERQRQANRPAEAGAKADPKTGKLPEKIDVPKSLMQRLKEATSLGDESKLREVIKEAAELGAGSAAVATVTEQVDEAKKKAAADKDDDGDESDVTVGASTKANAKEVESRSAKSSTSATSTETVTTDSTATKQDTSVAAAQTAALSLAVEEILKHLLERKDEEAKRREEEEARRTASEVSRKSERDAEEERNSSVRAKEQDDLADLILEKIRAEQELKEQQNAAKEKELSPKEAIESLVAQQNAQRQADAQAKAESEAALKGYTESVQRATAEHNAKVIQTVQLASREMLRNNIDAHVNELKGVLGQEISRMFEDVGKIREMKRELERDIAELFSMKAKYSAELPAPSTVGSDSGSKGKSSTDGASSVSSSSASSNNSKSSIQSGTKAPGKATPPTTTARNIGNGGPRPAAVPPASIPLGMANVPLVAPQASRFTSGVRGMLSPYSRAGAPAAMPMPMPMPGPTAGRPGLPPTPNQNPAAPPKDFVNPFSLTFGSRR